MLMMMMMMMKPHGSQASARNGELFFWDLEARRGLGLSGLALGPRLRLTSVNLCLGCNG